MVNAEVLENNLNKSRRILISFVMRTYGLPKEDAEDVFSKTSLELFSRISRLEEETLGALIYHHINFRALSFIRQRNRENRYLSKTSLDDPLPYEGGTIGDLIPDLENFSEEVHSNMLVRESLEIVEEILKSPKSKTIFRNNILGIENSDTAEELGMLPATIRSNFFRDKQLVREEVAKFLGELVEV